MTTDAVTALLAAPDPGTRLGLRDQFFMILMYDLAARDAEMLALNLADIDTRRLTADLPGKGSKPRRLPITSETARHFGRYAAVFHPSPEPAAPMFYTVRNHRPARMSDDNVARFVRQHATTAKARCPDVPARVHPHMLRHSRAMQDRKSTRLNSSHSQISYAVFCLKKKNEQHLVTLRGVGEHHQHEQADEDELDFRFNHAVAVPAEEPKRDRGQHVDQLNRHHTEK